MKLLRNPKIRIWLTLGLSLFGVSVAGLSTFAWFQIETTKKTLDDSNVVQSGSPDLTITDIKGHKVVPTLSPNTGMTDYSNSTVTTMDGNMKLVGTNYDQDDADTDFDVPNDGIGYYVITPNAAGAFKFAADGSNSWKFQEYDSQNFMYAADVDLPASTPFMIRSYTMAHNETVLSTVNIANDSFAGGSVSNNRATVSSAGRYKVWFDKGTNKVGVERTGNIPVRARINPKKAISTSGGDAIWLRPNSNWKSDSAKMVLDVYDGGGNHAWALMTQDGSTGYFYTTVPTGHTWTNIIFIRANSSYTNGVDWSKRWNQTSSLSFPTDDTNCYDFNSSNKWGTDSNGYNNDGLTGTWNERHAKIKVGNGSYVIMALNTSTNPIQWEYTFPSSVASGTQLQFQRYGSPITITRDADGDPPLQHINNLNVSGTTYTVGEGGTGLSVYLHNDATRTVWVDHPATPTATISIGGDSPATMSWDSTGSQWYYEASNVDDGDSLAFTVSGRSITDFTKNDDSSNPWYDKNNMNGSTKAIIRGVSGTETLMIYLHRDKTVWVKSVVEVQVASRGWVRMHDNSNNTDELKGAGLTAADNENVTFQVNGEALAYTLSGSDNNLVSNGSGGFKVIQGGTIDVYLRKVLTNGNPAKSAWATGNDDYDIKIGDGSWTAMSYSANGVFTISNQTAATNASLSVRKNGTTVITGTDYDPSATNNITSGPAIKMGGTGITITYNTSTKKFTASTVYHIQIASNTPQQATLSDGWYSITSNVNAAANAAVKVLMNGVEQTSYEPENDRDSGWLLNNCGGTSGALKVIEAVSSGTTFSFNTSTTKVWIDGHSRVFMIKFGSNAAVPMTDVKDGSQASYTVSSTVAASTAITITTSGGTNIAYTAKNPTVLNNLSGGSTINEISSGTIYFNYQTSQLWVPGKQQTYYFYTREASASLKMWQTSAGSEGDAIEMTQDGTDPHLFSYTYTVSTSYDYLRFIAGDRQSEKVNISESDCSGRYYYMTEDATDGKYGLRNEANPAGILTNAKMYLYDAGNYFAGTHNALIHKPSDSIVPYGGADYPGIAMTEVIPSALWVITGDRTNYDKIRFTGSYVTNYGTKESDVLDFTENNNNKVWVTTRVDGRTVKGGFATETSHSSTVGTATIHVRRGGNIVAGLETEMGLGDVVDSNLFIYEKGLRVQDGDVLTIEITGNSTDANNREYNDADFVVDTRKRPYLTRDGTNITVNLGATGTTGRFNFYLTNEYKIAIVEVPDMGNGFYIMDYKGPVTGTENYLGATKMATSSSATASYSGYYAQKDDQIFIRSYVNAVDKGYTTLVNNTGKTIDMTDGVITFGASDYYNISVSNGKVVIDPYDVDDFFCLNPLDTSKAGSPETIKAQKTSIVLEVSFTCENAYQSVISLDVTNGLSYVGAALYVTDTPVDSGLSPVSPYNFMRDNHYLLSAANATSIADSHTNFKTTANDGGTVYRAYILIDYLPQTGADAWSTYPEDSNIAFYLRSTQV